MSNAEYFQIGILIVCFITLVFSAIRVLKDDEWN